MKRKDWISLLSMLIIFGVALLGEQFVAGGNWIKASMELLIKLLPFVLFFVTAVLFRKRKGSYVQWWRRVSYGLFAISVLFLFLFSGPFMHYFNVTSSDSKESIKKATELVFQDCDNMFESYDTKVNDRVSNYGTQLETLVKQKEYDKLNSILRTKQTFYLISDIQRLKGAFSVAKFKDFKANKDSLKSLKPKFEKVLIHDFDPFKAAAEFNELLKLYNAYKNKLTDDYAIKNAVEEYNKEEFVFDFENHENEWRQAIKIFTEMEFNFFWFLLFVVLAIMAGSSYIFFKDDNVKMPTKRVGNQGIYERGHKF